MTGHCSVVKLMYDPDGLGPVQIEAHLSHWWSSQYSTDWHIRSHQI